MPNYAYERKIFEYLNNVKNTINTRPLNLGGVSGGAGGTGGPPGGFIGRLPQSRIAYDTDEDETWAVPSSTSLVTNLDRIRYRIAVLEDEVEVQENGVTKGTGIKILNFVNLSITVSGDTATITHT